LESLLEYLSGERTGKKSASAMEAVACPTTKQFWDPNIYISSELQYFVWDIASQSTK